MAERMVTIEDAIITSLLSNPKILSDIPALRTAASIKTAGSPGCAPCSRQGRAKSVNYSHVKSVIANLRGDSLAKIKKELGADKIRILFKNNAGKLVQLTM